MPEVHTPSTLQADRTFAERILKRADGLIAVSENTRQDAIRMLGIAPERIRTIYSGVADEYFDAPPRARVKPYVLFVGTIEPRKNLDTLLGAWRSVKPDIREHFELVIAGPEGWNSSGTMERVRQEANHLGYVPEAGMPGLIAGAALFVYPSLYEGFGFPVVQAMAANVPVLSSRTSCLPEIGGDAAVYVDPRSTSEINAQLTRLLESPEERTRLAQLGRARAECYRWGRCAKESLAFFREIAANERK
jgi:alpha-1,3-rhamnosyl/mannosyltransferase